MTYAEFLAFFLILPILLLGMAARRRIDARHRLSCLIICVIALLYTAPWDNHAAAQRLWTFDPHFVPARHFLFSLPWEEYAFYLLQGIFVCLLAVALAYRLRPKDGGIL